ncbi:MAG: hypothetical protein LK562_00320, partial [Candidatus Accumulibacter phosphatis]|nr:hypothetical protein [Candidatus Accumulibacter phosphatis]
MMAVVMALSVPDESPRAGRMPTHQAARAPFVLGQESRSKQTNYVLHRRNGKELLLGFRTYT